MDSFEVKVRKTETKASVADQDLHRMLPALHETLPEASVRQARHQVQEGSAPTGIPPSGRPREQ